MDPTTAFFVGVGVGAASMWILTQLMAARRQSDRSAATKPKPKRVPVVERSEAPRGFPTSSTADPLIETHRERRPRIVTRTTPSGPDPLYDPFMAEGERRCTPDEQRSLITLYEHQASVAEIAVRMQMDQRQVAATLIRMLMDPSGRIDNDEEMPYARRKYTEADLQYMRDAYGAAVPLPRIAHGLGRSQLGVGWRMIDLQIPTVPNPPRYRPGPPAR